jgi:hypothetical protein
MPGVLSPALKKKPHSRWIRGIEGGAFTTYRSDAMELSKILTCPLSTLKSRMKIMKMISKFFISAAAIGAMTSTPAWADQPGADWISRQKVEEVLKVAGYTQVTELEADDGRWEGEGVKQDGMKYEFHVDPHSGKITKDEKDD